MMKQMTDFDGVDVETSKAPCVDIDLGVLVWFAMFCLFVCFSTTKRGAQQDTGTES